MSEAGYKELIRELCETAGVGSGWERMAQTQHMEINGVTTAIVHDETTAPDTLGIYFDLGAAPEPDVAARLLEYNMAVKTDPIGTGRFGLLPREGSVVYRIDVPWTSSLGGAELSSLIAARLAAARLALDGCRSPR
jgi:hypothetical protein